ncbi:MAG: hypothetical protein WCO57_10065 [Verrucomicrobiota bacterium]
MKSFLSMFFVILVFLVVVGGGGLLWYLSFTSEFSRVESGPAAQPAPAPTRP